MFFSFLGSAMRRLALLTLGAAFLVPVVLSTPAVAAGPVVNPLISDWQFLIEQYNSAEPGSLQRLWPPLL